MSIEQYVGISTLPISHIIIHPFPIPHPSSIIPFPSPSACIPSARLTPHPLKLLNNQEIRIQKAVHTVPRTRLLALIQLPALDAAGHALGPADVCEVVDGYIQLALCPNGW